MVLIGGPRFGQASPRPRDTSFAYELSTEHPICAPARSLGQVEIITVSVFVLVSSFCTCFLLLNRVDVLLRVFSWACTAAFGARNPEDIITTTSRMIRLCITANIYEKGFSCYDLRGGSG